ncbi:MAG: glutathione S-transferase family protein [Rhodospirillaceae bacterium]|nr:glutathione S-transferase family protein [Rhodospirillaceae bacterium]
MTADAKITLFHSPNTRSTSVAVLLEELGAPHEIHWVNMKAGEQRKPAFLAVNPMGKVPAVKHGDAIVTEQGALFIYLADLFPKAGLTPALTDPLRGPYIRWLVYYGSCLEPAMVDKAMKREPGPLAMSPYGTFEAVIDTISGQLAKGPYLFGERITAADILWGMAIKWMTGFKLLPERPEFGAYVKRVTERPSFKKVGETDAKKVAEHEAAATKSG